jgi:Dihydrofolate reductase
MSNIKATILVAMDQNRAIGRNNQLLCDLPKDLEAFKEMTLGQVVIMGRKTQESLPHGYLDKRHNIVVTKQEHLSDDRLIITHSPVQALLRANVIVQNSNNIATGIFVIGGQQIYQEFIKQDLVDEIIITQILHKFEQCDAFFPPLDDNWRTASKSVKITDGDYKTERHVYAKIEACTENIS